jgi:uncharacterized protein YndB with AHSA1/START domain
MKKRSSTLLFACALFVLAAAAAAQEVENTSYRADDDTRVLQHRITVEAPAADVWDAWTTTEGIRSWAVPVGRIDFRLGGIWESSYNLDARIGDPGNIQNRILAYLPDRMLTIQAVAAPPGFPHRELLSEIFTVIELEALDAARTRVTVSMVGYASGEGFDVLYGHFEKGNAWTLEKLRQRFVEGPVDWASVLSDRSGGR